MTPAELDEQVDLFNRREDREWRRAAWMTHYIMATWLGKKAPSIDRLLGHVEDV